MGVLNIVVAVILLLPTSLAKSHDIIRCLEDILKIYLKQNSKTAFSTIQNKWTEKFGLLPPKLEDSSNIALYSISNLLTTPIWYVLTEKQNPIPDSKQVKNTDLDIFTIWLDIYQENKFTELINTIKTYRIVGPDTKVIIIIENNFELNVSLCITKFFKIIWQHLRAFYTCIIINMESEIELYNYNPFNKDKSIKWYEINRWKNGLKENTGIFPSLPTNFDGYKMHVVYIDRKPNVFPPDELDKEPTGPEPMSIRSIASIYNIAFTYSSVSTMSPDLANGKFYGVWKNVSTYQTDFVLTGMLIFSTRYHVSSLLFSYDYDSICMFVPKIRPNSTWRILYGAFQENVWVIIFLFFVVFVILLFINGAEQTSWSYVVLIVIKVHLESCIEDKKLQHQPKILYTLLLLYTMLVTLHFKSKSTMLRTIPEPPKNFESLFDINNEGLTFYFPRKVFTEYANTTQWRNVLDKGSYVISNDFSNNAYQTVVAHKGVFLYSSKAGKYVLNEEFGHLGGAHLANIFSAWKISQPIHTYMSPGNPLHPIFNAKTLQLVEGGFPGYWLSARSFLNRRSPHKEGPTVINLQDVSFAFFIISSMSVVTGAVFFVEYCSFFLGTKTLNNWYTVK